MSKAKTQGALLKELYEWSGKARQKEFTDEFKRSRDWYWKAIKWDIIPQKDKYDICRAYDIPMEYFDGKFQLPLKPVKTVNEDQGTYKTKYKTLEEKYYKVLEELNESKSEIISLQKELLLEKKMAKT